MAPFCFEGSFWLGKHVPPKSINQRLRTYIRATTTGRNVTTQFHAHVKRGRNVAISRLVLIFWKVGRHRHSVLLPSKSNEREACLSTLVVLFHASKNFVRCMCCCRLEKEHFGVTLSRQTNADRKSEESIDSL